MELKKLTKGKFLKRYKRFFMKVKKGNEVLLAHTPNTGTMKTVLDYLKET